MKVEPEQAVNAVIAFKERQRIQTQKEDKIMFDQVKNRKAFDKKKEEMIMKANGLKKKDLEGIRKETRKIFKQSLEAFKKIKRPEKEPAIQLLSRYAEKYGHRDLTTIIRRTLPSQFVSHQLPGAMVTCVIVRTQQSFRYSSPMG